MMNLAALCLIVIALIGAEVWSPGANPIITSKESTSKNDVVVKDGHRVVVVEYDQDGKPNTKITISPTMEHEKEDGGGFAGKAKEKIKETASDVLPNLGQGISQPEGEGGTGETEGKHRATAGELICDALGRCKHRIAGAIGKTKDKAHQVGDWSEEAVPAERDGSTHMAHGAQKISARKTDNVEEIVAQKTQDVKEGLAHKAHDVKERAAQKARDAKKSVAQEAHELKEGVAYKAQVAKEDVAHKTQEAKEGVAHMARKAEEAVAQSARNVSDGLIFAFNKILNMTETTVLMIGRVMNLSTLGRVIGMLGFSTAYGTSIWVTFLSSYVMGKLLPRQQLGMVQSKIYPVYFWAMGWTIGMALLGHFLGQGKRLFCLPVADMVQGFNLVCALLMVVANAVFFEPRATKAMFERMKIEKEEGRGRPMFVAELGSESGPQTQLQEKDGQKKVGHKVALRARMAELGERIKKLNSYSSWLNIMTLMSLTWYLVHIAQRLC